MPKPPRYVAKPGLNGVSPSEPSDHAVPSIYVPHRCPGRHALHVRQTNSKGLVLVPHLLWEEGQNPDLSEILQKWYHLGRIHSFQTALLKTCHRPMSAGSVTGCWPSGPITQDRHGGRWRHFAYSPPSCPRWRSRGFIRRESVLSVFAVGSHVKSAVTPTTVPVPSSEVGQELEKSDRHRA